MKKFFLKLIITLFLFTNISYADDLMNTYNIKIYTKDINDKLEENNISTIGNLEVYKNNDYQIEYNNKKYQYIRNISFQINENKNENTLNIKIKYKDNFKEYSSLITTKKNQLNDLTDFQFTVN